MRIRLISNYAGPGGSWSAGAVVEFSDAAARELITGGYAEPVAAPRESATRDPAETAVQPGPPRRRRAATGGE